MKQNHRFILMLLFLATCWTTFAQDKTVTGLVTDESSQPLPGVTVMVNGTIQGTTTDFDGRFTIELKENQNTLIFSYVGFKTLTINIEGKKEVNVTLKTDMVGLDEVVVVGYGAMRKSDLTGAVASVSGDALEKAASNRPLEAIQGRVSGLNITKSSGQPGAGMKVRIRGVGSTNNSDPLYVIDGVPSGTDMEHIAPEDIKSIEVLKDASSTAIYGNKGANGVIIVTTKSGNSSTKPVFSFNSYYGIGEVANQIDLLNATEHAQLILEASENDGISIPSDLFAMSNYVIANNYKGTDWQDEIFRTGTQKNYNLSVRGGIQGDDDQKMTYSISGTLYDEEGTVDNTGFKKYLLNSKTEYQFNDRVKIGLQLDLFRKEYGNFSEGIYSGPIPLALTVSPMDSGLDMNGNYIPMTTFSNNPLLVTDHLGNSDNSTNSYGLRSWLEYKLMEGLDFKTNFKLSRGNTHSKNYRPSYYINENFYRTDSELYEGRGEWYSWTWINLLNYTKEFNDVHKVIATLGQESSYDENMGFSGTGINVPEDGDLQFLNLAKEYKEQLGAWQGNGGSVSYFARAFYSYANKYMFTGTLRYDGSSKFSGDNQWGLFPSVGASWKADEEDFIKDLGVFSALKLRVGWGRVGNEASAQAGSDVANIGTYGMYYVFNDQLYQGGTTTNIPTPDLKWEVVETTNIGVDMGFFDGDLSVTADYFIKDTKDMITRVALPGYYPKDLPNANIGTMNNKGFEFSANYGKTYENFKFNVGANISIIENEIDKLNADNDSFISGGYIDKLGYTTRTEAGREIAYFYGYQTDGIFRSQDEINNYVGADGNLVQPNAQVGDVKFRDNSGNGVIDEADKTYLGSGQADFTYGFNFSMEYMGFDFSGNFYGVSGAEIVNGMSLRLLDVNDYFNGYSYRMNRFHPINNPNGSQPRVTLSDNNNNLRFSDRYVEDGSYLRLKNIQLGYSLPKNMIEHLGLTKLRLYVSGQNLLTFTDYKGFDPEIGDLTHDAGSDVSSLGIGVDLGNYPQPRLFYFGVNVTF
jgi:TonB-linked SusC/RagA family outer membrane protein